MGCRSSKSKVQHQTPIQENNEVVTIHIQQPEKKEKTELGKLLDMERKKSRRMTDLMGKGDYETFLKNQAEKRNLPP